MFSVVIILFCVVLPESRALHMQDMYYPSELHPWHLAISIIIVVVVLLLLYPHLRLGPIPGSVFRALFCIAWKSICGAVLGGSIKVYGMEGKHLNCCAPLLSIGIIFSSMVKIPSLLLHFSEASAFYLELHPEKWKGLNPGRLCSRQASSPLSLQPYETMFFFYLQRH